MAELVEIRFGMQTCVVPRNRVLDGGQVLAPSKCD